jgi:rod shape-determining protein MreB
MIGRTPVGIRAVRPLEKGVIADFATTVMMLHHFIGQMRKSRARFEIKPHVAIAVPSVATAVERRAVEDVIIEAGAKSAVTVETILAAAIGAGLDVAEARGSLVVNIGAGTTEVGLICLGGIVTHRAIRVGGDDMDELIARFIKKEHNMKIGEATAEKTKLEVGRALPSTTLETIAIRGRDLKTGLPKSVEVTSNDISQAITPVIQQIISVIKSVLEQAPAELVGDVMDSGILLTGGVAPLPDLDTVIAQETGLPVTVAENPMDCVAMGVGQVLDSSSASFVSISYS